MEYIKKEELIKGEIYKNTGNNIIFKCINDKTSQGIGFRIINKCFVRNNWFSSNPEYLLATPEEKHWLNCCITADKFITFEEAMKTFIPEYVECIKTSIDRFTKNKIYKVEDKGYVKAFVLLDDKNVNTILPMIGSLWSFKPSTKEAYDAQFVVKEPEFVLPENWGVKCNSSNYKPVKEWADYDWWKDNFNRFVTHNKTWLYANNGSYTEITFDQFKKYVLKEEIVEEKVIEPLPQFKIIESIETITKVENNEGNQFFIGDTVKSLNSEQKGKIVEFKYSANEANIIAITTFQSNNGIGIDKIEHYIEPKVEVEETLLDKAKRLYPIGTEYKCAYSGDTYDVIFQNFEQISNSKIHAENSKGCLLYGDKWVEIIK